MAHKKYKVKKRKRMTDTQFARAMQKKYKRTPVQDGRHRTGGYYRSSSDMFKEKRFWDITFSHVLTSTAGNFGSINLVPQGTGESQRLGRKMMIKSIQCRGYFDYAPGTSAVGAGFGTAMLVLDKQANGANAAAADVIDSTSAHIGVRNLANANRFTVLKKIDMAMQTGGGVSAAFANSVERVDFYHKCDIPIEFSSTTGAITEIKSNNLFWLLGSSTEASGAITFAGTLRLRYYA